MVACAFNPYIPGAGGSLNLRLDWSSVRLARVNGKTVLKKIMNVFADVL